MIPAQTGVTFSDPDRVTPGHILFAPAGGDTVYLVNRAGHESHRWTVGHGFTFWCSLLKNGNLFVNERSAERKGVTLTSSGVMREYDWDGALVWEHRDPYQHHDARKLDTGGVMYLAYTEMEPAEQALVQGGVPGSEAEGGLFGEVIREVDAAGEVVWEWPLSNLGYDQFPLHRNANRWSNGHTNTVLPLDDGRVLVSCKVMNLLFMVDKTSNEVVWHYQDDEMGGQHDAQMLDNGNILIFANGAYASDLHFSQVWEIDPNSNTVVWSYATKDNPQSFFSPHIGGCQRLPSGNTLICEGAKGCLFEVTPDGEIVWQYICPYTAEVPTFGKINWLFRARHYAPDAPDLGGRV